MTNKHSGITSTTIRHTINDNNNKPSANVTNVDLEQKRHDEVLHSLQFPPATQRNAADDFAAQHVDVLEQDIKNRIKKGLSLLEMVENEADQQLTNSRSNNNNNINSNNSTLIKPRQPARYYRRSSSSARVTSSNTSTSNNNNNNTSNNIFNLNNIGSSTFSSAIVTNSNNISNSNRHTITPKGGVQMPLSPQKRLTSAQLRIQQQHQEQLQQHTSNNNNSTAVMVELVPELAIHHIDIDKIDSEFGPKRPYNKNRTKTGKNKSGDEYDSDDSDDNNVKVNNNNTSSNNNNNNNNTDDDDHSIASSTRSDPMFGNVIIDPTNGDTTTSNNNTSNNNNNTSNNRQNKLQPTAARKKIVPRIKNIDVSLLPVGSLSLQNTARSITNSNNNNNNNNTSIDTNKGIANTPHNNNNISNTARNTLVKGNSKIPHAPPPPLQLSARKLVDNNNSNSNNSNIKQPLVTIPTIPTISTMNREDLVVSARSIHSSHSNTNITTSNNNNNSSNNKNSNKRKNKRIKTNNNNTSNNSDNDADNDDENDNNNNNNDEELNYYQNNNNNNNNSNNTYYNHHNRILLEQQEQMQREDEAMHVFEEKVLENKRMKAELMLIKQLQDMQRTEDQRERVTRLRDDKQQSKEKHMAWHMERMDRIKAQTHNEKQELDMQNTIKTQNEQDRLKRQTDVHRLSKKIHLYKVHAEKFSKNFSAQHCMIAKQLAKRELETKKEYDTHKIVETVAQRKHQNLLRRHRMEALWFQELNRKRAIVSYSNTILKRQVETRRITDATAARNRVQNMIQQQNYAKQQQQHGGETTAGIDNRNNINNNINHRHRQNLSRHLIDDTTAQEPANQQEEQEEQPVEALPSTTQATSTNIQQQQQPSLLNEHLVMLNQQQQHYLHLNTDKAIALQTHTINIPDSQQLSPTLPSRLMMMQSHDNQIQEEENIDTTNQNYQQHHVHYNHLYNNNNHLQQQQAIVHHQQAQQQQQQHFEYTRMGPSVDSVYPFKRVSIDPSSTNPIMMAQAAHEAATRGYYQPSVLDHQALANSNSSKKQYPTSTSAGAIASSAVSTSKLNTSAIMASSSSRFKNPRYQKSRAQLKLEELQIRQQMTLNQRLMNQIEEKKAVAMAAISSGMSDTNSTVFENTNYRRADEALSNLIQQAEIHD